VLDRNGFRFVRHDTKVADFYDEDEIRRVLLPGDGALVKAESGASRVVVFDHTLRTATTSSARRADREVVRRVHNDYTECPAPQRVRDLLPDEADELLKRRFAIVQVGGRSATRRELPARDLRWRAASRPAIFW